MKKDHKAEALRWLDLLRGTNGGGSYDSFFSYLRTEVAKAGCSLADIGTSEEEIARLRAENAKAYAKTWLDLLRNCTGSSYESFIDYLRAEVAKAGCSLADIGTSEEEIARLRAENAKAYAKTWLKILRVKGRDRHDRSNLLSYLRKEVEKAGCSLADIGTTEEELVSFVAQ